jgi:lactoylglutathione lyase
MRIEHLAIWVKDLERQKKFYEKYFDAKAGELYFNPKKNFRSYFLNLEGGCRLELMQKPEIPESKNDVHHQNIGLIHFAISVGSAEQVDMLTSQLREDGFEILDGPRTTGDGYYESVVLDAEGNRIEITV